MDDIVSAEMRAVITQVVREVVAGSAPEPSSGASGAAAVTPSAGLSLASMPQPTGPQNGAARSRIEEVRIVESNDLQQFAMRLLGLFDNPKNREDLRTGRLTFALLGSLAGGATPGAVERIERGAVTERTIAAAASAGTRLVLGKQAVLTPLAREKARALGVLVEKER